jgi:hypothetical protein
VGTDTPAKVFWGNESIDFEDLSSVAVLFQEELFILASNLDISYYFAFLVYKSFVEGHGSTAITARMSHNFVYTLHRFNQEQECTDPRDRVFALLGHYSARTGPENQLIMKADYNMSKEEVYRKIATTTLLEVKTMLILNMVEHGGKHNSSHISALRLVNINVESISTPSWIPDWDLGFNRQSFPKATVDVSGAALDRPQVVRVIEPEHVLQIDGVKIDTVERTSEELTYSLTEAEANDGSEDHVLYRLWVEICGQKPVFGFKPVYTPTKSSALVAFLDTIRRGWEEPPTSRPGGAEAPVLDAESSHGIACLSKLRPSVLLALDISGPIMHLGYDAWLSGVRTYAVGRRLVRTKGGYYGLCPVLVEEGDVIAVLFGGITPYILRPRGKSYVLVGECYIHGLMQGQALELLNVGKLTEETFEIR